MLVLQDFPIEQSYRGQGSRIGDPESGGRVKMQKGAAQVTLETGQQQFTLLLDFIRHNPVATPLSRISIPRFGTSV